MHAHTFCDDCDKHSFVPTDNPQITPKWSERIVLVFRPRSCCSPASAFLPEDEAACPPALLNSNLKVTPEVWKKWTDDYNNTVAPESPMVWTIVTLIVMIILVIPIFVFLCCGDMGKMPYQRRVAEWLQRVNSDIRPYGGTAKLQTCVTSYGKQSVERSAISFALTNSESAQLESEPILVHGGCCCENNNWWCPAERTRVV